jgi:hypothetical protein
MQQARGGKRQAAVAPTKHHQWPRGCRASLPAPLLADGSQSKSLPPFHGNACNDRTATAWSLHADRPKSPSGT